MKKRGKLLTQGEAADHADVVRQTIYNWTYNGIRVGSRGRRVFLDAHIHEGEVVYRLITLDEFLDQIGYEPADEEDDDE